MTSFGRFESFIWSFICRRVSSVPKLAFTFDAPNQTLVDVVMPHAGLVLVCMVFSFYKFYKLFYFIVIFYISSPQTNVPYQSRF